MKKVEQYIKNYTRNCSNEYLTDGKLDVLGGYISRRKFSPWLTPDHARNVAEIAREETIKEVCEWLRKNMVQYMEYCHNGTGESVEEFTADLKKHLEGKK